MPSFQELGLSDAILRALDEQGYTTPTPIQAQAIPAVLKGGDLLAAAQTGTGKTAGFTLPILQKLSTQATISAKPVLQVLILAPTRELAAQIDENIRNYRKYLNLRSGVIFGGVGINPQIAMIRKGLDILVATPGRLLDLHSQKQIDLSRITTLVLDEADRMLDMGFIHDIKKILAILPAQRQNLLFSATFSDEIKALAERLLNQPAVIEVTPRNSTVDVISQTIHPVDRDKKHLLLGHLILSQNWHQVLVFTRTKHGANRLVEQLAKQNVSAMAIHGNKSQSARTKALQEFKEGKLRALIATDIAARGIDIDMLPHVVNYELPHVPEDYVHRIGRTGRAGNDGSAISLVCVDEDKLLAAIEKFTRRKIARVEIEGFVPDPNAKAEPIQFRSFDHQARSQQPRNNRAAKQKMATTGKPRSDVHRGGRPGSNQAGTPANKGNQRRHAALLSQSTKAG